MIDVKGNGNIVSAEKNISSFIRLHISINCTVELIQADEAGGQSAELNFRGPPANGYDGRGGGATQHRK